ncbi:MULTISPECIES: flavodoxin family protein [Sphingomonas]|uniref:flavodoxin family protein n=1 Tax=Sphingomonas TaxID=13687 RepID=UPI000DEECDC3|nr:MULTISPECIES: NAD(P)H-dependent oxidoreductase [Sphingomonas]
MPLTAVALNCSLKPSSGKPSSTDAMIKVIADEFAKHDVTVSETIRLADHDVKPGVESDLGEGDAWPGIRAKILAADILIFGTPIWMGQTCSVAKRALERMDAFLSETDEQGRMPSFGKLAVAAIVGNEDGAHNVTADLFQSLNDTGWTIPSAASCYWVGEAMHKTDFNQLPATPKEVQQTAAMLASNAAHLAKLLKGEAYPGVKQEG